MKAETVVKVLVVWATFLAIVTAGSRQLFREEPRAYGPAFKLPVFQWECFKIVLAEGQKFSNFTLLQPSLLVVAGGKVSIENVVWLGTCPFHPAVLVEQDAILLGLEK